MVTKRALRGQSLKELLQKDQELVDLLKRTGDGTFAKVYQKRQDRVYKKGQVFLKIEGNPSETSLSALKTLMELQKGLSELEVIKTHVMHVLYVKQFRLVGRKNPVQVMVSKNAGENVDEFFPGKVDFEPPTDDDIIHMASDLLQGLDYMHHEMDHTHMDFHPTNFVRNEDSGVWTVIDMDWAHDLSSIKSDDKCIHFCHHPFYPLHTHPYIVHDLKAIHDVDAQKDLGVFDRFCKSYNINSLVEIYIVMDHFQYIMSVLSYLGLELPHDVYKTMNKKMAEQIATQYFRGYEYVAKDEALKIVTNFLVYLNLVMNDKGEEAENLLDGMAFLREKRKDIPATHPIRGANYKFDKDKFNVSVFNNVKPVVATPLIMDNANPPPPFKRNRSYDQLSAELFDHFNKNKKLKVVHSQGNVTKYALPI
jgi:hypothetical protein